MLRLAINLSMLFQELPWAERFDAARQAGFDTLEIQFPYHLDRFQLQQTLLDNKQKLILINMPAGDLMDGGTGIACQPDAETAFASAMQQARQWACLLKVPRINILSGRARSDQDRSMLLDCLIRRTRMAAAYFAESGIATCLETINPWDMPGFLLSDVETTLACLESLPAELNVGWQFDFYHLARIGANIPRLLNQHIDRIHHIQFADHPGRGQPGTGTSELAAWIRLAETLGYKGYFSAEYKPQGATTTTLGWVEEFGENAAAP